MEVQENGLYILSDSYFAKYNTGRMMDNKLENRPHFFSLRVGEVLWMIPISSKVDKYRTAIARDEAAGKKALFYHIGVIAGREAAFLIGDMIPVTEKYIVRPYTICGNPYVVANSNLVRQLATKAKRYLKLVEQHRIRPHVDILSIRNDLIKTDDHQAQPQM